MTDAQLAEMNAKFNEIINRAFPDMFGGQANYRYYSPSKPKNKSRKQDQYFWTVRRINHKGYKRFVSGVYRYKASEKSWTPIKQVGHAKKKDAIARASKLASNNA